LGNLIAHQVSTKNRTTRVAVILPGSMLQLGSSQLNAVVSSCKKFRAPVITATPILRIGSSQYG
jgi:hypothetical protein